MISKRGTLFIALFIALVTVSSGYALPEYQVKYQQTCALCHHAPTGGGMRTLYGAQFFSYTDLPVSKLDFAEMERVKPQLNDNIQFGFDLRGLFYLQNDFEDSDQPSQGTDHNQFVLMQADAYISAKLSDQAHVLLDFSRNGVQEGYALFRGLPMTGVVRAGKFMPSYGWRFADHKLFTRRFLDYGGTRGAGPKSYDSGVELGFYPEGWDITVGIFNGVANSNGKATVARIARRHTLGGLNLSIGGSYRLEDWGNASESDQFYGSFYGANLGRLTFLGEVDWLDMQTQGYVMTQQLRYMIRNGVYLNTYYEFFDSDLDIKAGNYWRTRFTADIIPRGYYSITPAFEWNHDPNGDEYGIGEVQLHVWL